MKVPVVDSHTEGEPTRVVLEGACSFGDGTVAEQAEILERDFDHLRRGVVLEPRGSDVVVAAFLVPPRMSAAEVGVIFVNNAGTLGMCVHGTIGVVRTLAHLGRVDDRPGREVRIETPVGPVTATFAVDGGIAVENVPSHRALHRVPVELSDRTVHADVAWGGNWFALVSDHGVRLESSRIEELTSLSRSIRRVLNERGLDRRGDRGGEVDHVELFAPGPDTGLSRNFVLCPGGAYDRSPCGTGTSAKIACLAAEGRLAPGERWVQESIIGSRFEGWYRPHEETDAVVPTIQGRAWITAEATLVLDERDPFRHGIVEPS
ncbi:MAG: proline racemase family protein [Planctomycetota bacterium]|nr:proline racemase family protein [Planctomycetota bacterium]